MSVCAPGAHISDHVARTGGCPETTSRDEEWFREIPSTRKGRLVVVPDVEVVMWEMGPWFWAVPEDSPRTGQVVMAVVWKPQEAFLLQGFMSEQ